MIPTSCFWTHSQCGIPLVFVFSCRHVNTCNMTTHNVKSPSRLLRHCLPIKQENTQTNTCFSFWKCQNITTQRTCRVCAATNNSAVCGKAQCGGIWVSGAVLHAYSPVNVVCVHGPGVSSAWSLWKGQKWCSVSGMKNDLLMCEDFQMSLHHGVWLTYIQYLSGF